MKRSLSLTAMPDGGMCGKGAPAKVGGHSGDFSDVPGDDQMSRSAGSLEGQPARRCSDSPGALLG